MRRSKKETSGHGLLGGLGDLVTRLAQQAEAEGGLRHEGTLEGLGEGVQGVYGISVRFLGGEPRVRSFGNLRQTERGPVLEETREPLVDVFDEGEAVRVLAELPGATDEDIRWEARGARLTLEALSKPRRYAAVVELPAEVEADGARTSLRNGIFECILPKRKAARP